MGLHICVKIIIQQFIAPNSVAHFYKNLHPMINRPQRGRILNIAPQLNFPTFRPQISHP